MASEIVPDFPVPGFIRARDDRVRRSGVCLERILERAPKRSRATASTGIGDSGFKYLDGDYLVSDYYGTPDQLIEAGLVRPRRRSGEFRWPRGRMRVYAGTAHYGEDDRGVRRMDEGVFRVRFRQPTPIDLAVLAPDLERYEIRCGIEEHVIHYGSAPALIEHGVITDQDLKDRGDEENTWCLTEMADGWLLHTRDLRAERRVAERERERAERDTEAAANWTDPVRYRQFMMVLVESYGFGVLSAAAGQSGKGAPRLWLDNQSYRRLQELQTQICSIVQHARICGPSSAPTLRLVSSSTPDQPGLTQCLSA